jgi:2-C-methyl-D-erythritol 4-phosphate cytidylyltransferase / 2-C-methyl-D-erythritol 2,4-cyclodiphosphate synthase
MKTAVIIPAGGIGSRLGAVIPKQFIQLDNIPVLIHTIHAFQHIPSIEKIVISAPRAHYSETRQLIETHALSQICTIVIGGKYRQDSVQAGLESLENNYDLVMVHDGARPCLTPELIINCLEQAKITGAAMAAVPVKDTLKSVDSSNLITGTINREGVWQAQTPQVARYDLLIRAFKQASQDNFYGTDESSLLERINIPVSIVASSRENLKITTAEDLMFAEAIIQNRSKQKKCPSEKKESLQEKEQRKFRIGHGYDAHCLGRDRDLILGGVKIPHSTGLIGHSDADVLTHALCDALLGAAGQGDIGKHFPDSDNKYKGISSLILLGEVIKIISGQGLLLGNADITIIAQKPRLSTFIPEMRNNLASICQVPASIINIKATTTEKMGFTGREEGISAHCVVMLTS